MLIGNSLYWCFATLAQIQVTIRLVNGLTARHAAILERNAKLSPSWKEPSTDAYGIVEYTVSNHKLKTLNIPPAGLRIVKPNDAGYAKLTGEHMDVTFSARLKFRYFNPSNTSQFLIHNGSLNIGYEAGAFNFQAKVDGNQINPIFSRSTARLIGPKEWKHKPWEKKLSADEQTFTNQVIDVLNEIKLNEAMFYAASQLAIQCPDLFLKGDASAPCAETVANNGTVMANSDE